MAVWSSLASGNFGKLNVARKLIASIANGCKGKGVNYVPVRGSHDRTLVIKPSSFTAFKFKDMFYLYFTIGAIPFLSIILYNNIFIGPATLALIPEGYEPEHWEYYRHPITRFLAKNFVPSNQENYERSLHTIFYTKEKEMLRQLEKKIKKMISEREDYQAWYFTKPPVKYVRMSREHMEEAERVSGKPGGWIK